MANVGVWGVEGGNWEGEMVEDWEELVWEIWGWEVERDLL